MSPTQPSPTTVAPFVSTELGVGGRDHLSLDTALESPFSSASLGVVLIGTHEAVVPREACSCKVSYVPEFKFIWRVVGGWKGGGEDA